LIYGGVENMKTVIKMRGFSAWSSIQYCYNTCRQWIIFQQFKNWEADLFGLIELFSIDGQLLLGIALSVRPDILGPSPPFFI
jgi:hypothetical protein